jgi:heptose-I-phosphate ethanolaminephosphotransferase
MGDGVLANGLRSAWRWRWLWAMNLFLISPVLLYELRFGEGGPDKTLAFILGASVLWLASVNLLARRPWVVHALMFPLYLVVATDLYVIHAFNTRLSSSMLLTMFQNLEDGRAYFQTHGGPVAIGVGALLLFYAVGIWRIRHLRHDLPRKAALVPLSLLVLVYVGVFHVLGLWAWVMTNDRDSPFGIFPQAYTSLSLYDQSLKDAEASKNFRFHAIRHDAPKGPEIYVLVVGESSRPLNWQLYGYPRATNPELSGLSNLVVFQDVITQAAVTRRSVPLILTRGTIQDEERTARERSIVSAFEEAGFETFWISTQERDPFTGAINRYPREADVTRFYERRYDGIVVDAMRELLAEHQRTHQKLFFVIHTLGSHFNMKSRFPKAFARFPTEDPQLTDRQRLVNAYDDTVLYTDHVLGGLVDLLSKQEGIKGLVYVSDHGENLEDDARDIYGHYQNNEYDLPIPMLFWYSDELARAFPGKVAAARANADRPLNTRVVFPSLADLANIDVPDTAPLSVFAKPLEPYERFVMGDPKPWSFDGSPLAPRVREVRHGEKKKLVLGSASP